MTIDVLIALTIGLPWLGAVAVWIAGDERANLQHALAVIFAALAAVAAVAMLPLTTNEPALTLSLGGFFGEMTFVPDGLAVFLAVVATVIGGLAVIFSVDYMRGEAGLGRYYGLVLLFIGSMTGLVLSNSLLLLFLFWEMTALCSYGLISFYNDDPKAVAGGIKALIITQIGGLGLLIGVLAARSALGSDSISFMLANAHGISIDVLMLIAFGFLVAAAAKSAQVPFHTWLPGAMEAPTPISALIHAATMVNAGVYLLARFYPAFMDVPGWAGAVALIGLLSALLAAVMAIFANDLKRALAYSTISQLGYMVYAVGVGGIYASQFHLLSHAVFKALLFLGAGAVIHAVGTRDMFKMGGLWKKMSFTAVAFIVGAWALAGLPILNGFWSKEMVLEAGLAGGQTWDWVVMVVGAGLTAFYTARMVYLVFFGQDRTEGKHVHDAPTFMKIALGVLALGTFGTWLLAGRFSVLLAQAYERAEYEIHTAYTVEFLREVLVAPATWVAMGAVALGLIAWALRGRLAKMLFDMSALEQAAQNDFGFEWINRRVAALTQSAAQSLRVTQTGQLSWNAVGIVAALIVVLVVLVLGRGN